MHAQTLAQKLIARASGLDQVHAGEIVQCAVDLAAFHDSSGPRRLKPMLEQIQATIWDKNKVALVLDHYVPGEDLEAIKILELSREWAIDQSLPHFYDSEGIIHALLPEKGHILPGKFYVGGDSHSCTGGAFGAYMFGIGSTEMLGVITTGEIWVKVPETIRMNWQGKLSVGVTAKDMMLAMIAKFGVNGANYAAVEYAGSTIATLSMQERMTLSNMAAELGAQVGLIAPDQITVDYLQQRKIETSALVEQLPHWQTDLNATCENEYMFSASHLTPMIAAPYSPSNSLPVNTFTDIPIHVAYIGACTGAKFEDISAAATVLKNHKVAKGTRLLLAPASKIDQARAKESGALQQLLDAGAELLPTACGACAGYGNALNGAGNVLSTTARNFRGRMGDQGTQVYLGSPYSVAAAAVAGSIIDPREFLKD